MQRAFTIIEVSILFVIFLIVAFLVAPMSMNDSRQVRYAASWRNVQAEFANIFYTTFAEAGEDVGKIKSRFTNILNAELNEEVKPYKIVYLNGTFPSKTYRFEKYFLTNQNASIAVKFFEVPQDDLIGILMYDVNGKLAPNTWGKDVFGFNIYSDKFEPFCKEKPINIQNQDCSKDGTGLCCSNYYLIGGSFD